MTMPRAFLRSACLSLCLATALQPGCAAPDDLAAEERAVTPVEWIGIGLAIIGIAVSAGAWLDAVLTDDTRVSVASLDDMTLLTGVGVQIPFSATLEFEDTLGYQEPWFELIVVKRELDGDGNVIAGEDEPLIYRRYPDVNPTGDDFAEQYGVIDEEGANDSVAKTVDGSIVVVGGAGCHGGTTPSTNKIQLVVEATVWNDNIPNNMMPMDGLNRWDATKGQLRREVDGEEMEVLATKQEQATYEVKNPYWAEFSKPAQSGAPDWFVNDGYYDGCYPSYDNELVVGKIGGVTFPGSVQSFAPVNEKATLTATSDQGFVLTGDFEVPISEDGDTLTVHGRSTTRWRNRGPAPNERASYSVSITGNLNPNLPHFGGKAFSTDPLMALDRCFYIEKILNAFPVNHSCAVDVMPPTPPPSSPTPTPGTYPMMP